MLYSKGNSSCHTYSDQGKSNHELINWSSSSGKCKNRVLRGKKGSICTLGYDDCPQQNSEFVKCPIFRYEPQGIVVKSND